MRTTRGFFLLLLVLLFGLSGCGDSGGGNGDQAEQTVLSHWGGQWTNLNGFLDEAAMDAAYVRIAEEANAMSSTEGITYTADDAAWFTKSMYQTGFGDVVFDGDQVTYYDHGGEVTCRAGYEFAGTEQVEFYGESFDWFKFELADDEDACPDYPYLVLTTVHSHGDDAKHFHLRAGAVGFEDLINNPAYGLWFPTLAESTVTLEEIAAETLESARMAAAFMLQSLTMWSGDWISFNYFIDDPAMESIYEAVAEAAPGYTTAEVKEALQQMFYTNFGGLTVSDETIGFHDPAYQALSGQCGYQFAGTTPFFHDGGTYPFYNFLRASDDVSCPKYILAMERHQDQPGSLVHWHMRYGDVGFEDLANNPAYQMWYPTLASSSSTVDDVIASFPDPEELAAMFPTRVLNQVDSQELRYITVEGGETRQLTMPEDCMEYENGQQKFCLCQAIAFRISQILSRLWPDGVFRSYDIKMETGWSTDGPEEFWGPDKLAAAELQYADPITPAKDLTLADSWYAATVISTGLTYTFYGTDLIYINNFLELRSKVKNGTATEEEKARMQALRAQIVENVKAIPFDDMFVIDQL